MIGIAHRSDLLTPASVLIIKPSSLGDVVSAVPVLRGLRRSFPQARIAWLLNKNCAPLLQHEEDLDEVIIFDRNKLARAWRSPSATRELGGLLVRLRAGAFQWVLDLQGLLRSGLLAAATGAEVRAGFADAREGATMFYTHRVRPRQSHTVDRNIALARRLGIDARPSDMKLTVPPTAQAFAEAFRRRGDLKGKDYLICIPPTRWATKRYPVRHWRVVLSALVRKIPVVLLGAPGEEKFSALAGRGVPKDLTDLTGKTTIPQMVALIAASAGVVCSDSAAKFIAPAVGVDVVSLLGPTRLERTGPYPRGHAVVAPVPCQGCLKRHCRHVSCMELIDPAEVISTTMNMLASGRA